MARMNQNKSLGSTANRLQTCYFGKWEVDRKATMSAIVRTVGEGKRGRSPSLYHSRQCDIVTKPRLDCLDYTVVCFVTQGCS